jgi:hypothetical protein
MMQPVKFRRYHYVNRSFEHVRERLWDQPLELLRRATTPSSARTAPPAANIRVSVGGVDVGVEVSPRLRKIRDEVPADGLTPVTCLELSWQATHSPALFPSMQLELYAWPLSADETQLEVAGAYKPPFGAVGHAIDAAIGHRIAEASVVRFLEDVAEQIQRELPAAQVTPAT